MHLMSYFLGKVKKAARGHICKSVYKTASNNLFAGKTIICIERHGNGRIGQYLSFVLFEYIYIYI